MYLPVAALSFDTQECTMDLEVGEYDRDVMIIHPEKLEMIGRTLLSQYFITKWDLDYKHKGKGIQTCSLFTSKQIFSMQKQTNIKINGC